MAFFKGQRHQHLGRQEPAREVRGAVRWGPKNLFAHLVKRERNRQHLLRRALASETRDVQLRLQYPEGMPLPGILGNWDALTPEEQERLEMAVGSGNQAY